MDRKIKGSLVSGAALALAIGAIVLSAAPASATTEPNVHGTQWGSTQVYYSYGRTNTHAYNGMSVSPYNGADCGTYTLLVGARYTQAAGASNGKTGTMSAGQTSAFFNSNLGNYRMPMGTFYLTVATGPDGSCPNYTPTWSLTLIYNVAN